MNLDSYSHTDDVSVIWRAAQMTGTIVVAFICVVSTSAPAWSQSNPGGSTSEQLSKPLTICQTNVERNSGEPSVERTAGEVSNVVQSLSKRIYSPYCPGKTLSMCPSGGAASVRRDIQRLAREGWSIRAIENAVLDACGEEYRLEEPPTGDNYVMLTVVALGLLLCLFAIWYFSRGAGDATDDDGSESDEESLDDRDRRRLDDIRHEYRE